MLKHAFYLLIALSFLLPHSTFGQIDSLKNRLSSSLEPEDKINTSIILVERLMQEDLDEAAKYAKSALSLAKKENDKLHERDLLNQLGQIASYQGDYQNSISYFNQAIDIQLPLEHGETISSSFNYLGQNYYRMGEYDNCLDNFFKALDVMEKTDNKEGQAFYLGNIGVIYDIQEVYDKALEYYQKSLDLKISTGMEESYASSYTNIGVCHYNLGDTKTSLENHEKALELYKKFENQRGIAKALNNIGYAHDDMGDNKLAISYFSQSLKMRLVMGDTKEISTSYNNISQAYFNIENYDSSLFYSDKCLEIALASNQKSVLKSNYEVRYKIFKNLNQIDNALTALEGFSTYTDSLQNEEIYSEMAAVESQYELALKENELQKQAFEIERQTLEISEGNQKRNFYLAILIAAIILIVLLYIRSRQKSRINKLIQSQVDLISLQNEKLAEDKKVLYSELADKKEVLDKVYTKNRQELLPPEILELTKREMEVLSFLALGWTDKELAEKLFISKTTVKTHLRRIYSKLLVKGRAGAVAIAHKYKIIGSIDTEE